MSIRRGLYLMTTGLVVAGMVGGPFQAAAQDAGDGYAGNPGGDPPTRVGRLAVIEGTVSTHAGGEDHWSPATLNAPVSTGDAFWTEPSARAEVEVTASAVWMDQSTEFDLTTLDDNTMHASEPQGEVYAHLSRLQPNETYTFETPRGTVSMAVDGRYAVAAGDTDHPTTVTVLEGSAQITGNNISLQVHANQTASITGTTTFEGSVGPLVQDDFLAAMLRREAPVAASGGPAPPIVAEMTGGDDLAQYGSWQDNSDYGHVWYPQVGSDWAPYREGRWSYVAPWGWTWNDAAPWGFAPFHYGRWVQIGPRWGWAPGYAGYEGGYRPAYAPALVSFFGIGVGIGVGVGIGFGRDAAFGPRGNIGWVPLGPREAYYPPYRTSRGYLTRVNVTNIRNVTNIYNEAGTRRDLAIGRYENARGATLVPARAMQESRPIAGAYRRPTEAELSGTHGLVDRAPIAPGAHTAGLTPRTAAALHVADYHARTAPGPQLRPAEARGETRKPELRDARGGGAAARPGAPGPAMRGEQGAGGLPALRGPGARPEAGADRAAAPSRDHGAAPGPQIGHASETGRPGLRAPGASPMGDRGAGREPPAERGQAGRSPALDREPTAPRAMPERGGAPMHEPAATREPTRPTAPAREPMTTHEPPRHIGTPAAPREPAPSHEPPMARERPEPPRQQAPREQAPRQQAPREQAPREQAPRQQAAPRPEAPRPQPRPAPEEHHAPDRKGPGH